MPFLQDKYPKFHAAVVKTVHELQLGKRLLSEEKKFYVYVLMDPRKKGKYVYKVHGRKIKFLHEPFYIGKGFGGRMYRHTAEALVSDRNTAKLNKIRKLYSLGFEPIVKRVSSGVDVESVALAKEILLIEAIGRKHLGLGPLTNVSAGGEGATGVVLSEERKQQIREANTGRTLSEETKRKIGLASLGRQHSEATKALIGAKNSGRILSEEQLAQRKIARQGLKMSAESVAKRVASNTGKRRSGKALANLQAAVQVRNSQEAKCPHCDKVGQHIAMLRWHFDNCKAA